MLGRFGAIREPVSPEAWIFPAAARGLEPRAYTALAPMRDQKTLGSCVGFTYATVLCGLSGGDFIASPLALYRNFRIKSGFPVTQDSGAFMEPAARALVEWGAGSEALWPYRPDKFADKPGDDYNRQAMDHRVMSWYRASTVAQAKAAIAQGLPVAGAFDVPASFREVRESGLWIDKGGRAVGAHACAIVGYDDDRHGGAFLWQNQWGPNWGAIHPLATDGSRGWFWMTYDTYAGSPRIWDAVTITTFDLESGVGR